MAIQARKVEGAEEVSKIEQVAAPVEESSPAEPVKVVKEVKEVTSVTPVEIKSVEETVKVEESPNEAEKVVESDIKERSGPLKVLATIKRNLASPRKGEKKEEGDPEKEEVLLSPKEKVLDKLVGRIFKKDECDCKLAVEEKAAAKDGETAAAETIAELPATVPTAEDSIKPTEEKKEEKSKANQLYGQIVKALSPRKACGKQSNVSSFENQAETPKPENDQTEIAAVEYPVEAETFEKGKKEADSEPASPGMLSVIKKKATVFVHSLEEKVCKVKEEVKTEEKPTEQAAAPVEDSSTVTEVPAEQEQNKTEAKKETKKEIVGNFIGGVKTKIQEVMSKDQESKEAVKTKEEPVVPTTNSEVEKVEEATQAQGENKKEVFPVHELKYDDEANREVPAQEQTSQKWKNRMSGLFNFKKGSAEEHVESETSAAPASTSTSTPETEAAPVIVSKETTESTEPAPVATVEGDAKDCAIRLAQLYLQTPAAAEAVKEVPMAVAEARETVTAKV